MDRSWLGWGREAWWGSVVVGTTRLVQESSTARFGDYVRVSKHSVRPLAASKLALRSDTFRNRQAPNDTIAQERYTLEQSGV